MFDIKAKVQKANIQPVGTQLKVATPITDRITDVKQAQPSRQVPMTKGGKKLNVSVVREYHKESAKRPSLNIPQPLKHCLYDALHEEQGSPIPESIPRH